MNKNLHLLRQRAIFFAFCLLISTISFGQTSVNYNTPGTYTFTVPTGVTSIKVEAWGSGSGGNNNINRGGGGGAFAGNNTLSVTSGGTYTIVVGAGAGAGTGDSGSDSSFGNLVIAKGGDGANGGLATASTGTIRNNGGNGGSSSGNAGAGGGGSGGAGGAGAAGGNTNSNTIGTGGIAGASGTGSAGASGGDGGTNNNNGVNGNFPGGGGGERGRNGSVASGGGGNGRVIITYCPIFSLSSVSVPTSGCNSPGSVAVTLNSTTTGLPVGTYTVTYNRNDPSATGLTATMVVTTAGTGTFTATGFTNANNSGTTITVTSLASGSCLNTISANNVSNTFVMRAALSAPSGLSDSYVSCSVRNLQWNNGAPFVDRYYLDISNSSSFATFESGYNAKDLGTSYSENVSGLISGATYYYRVRSQNACGYSSYSSNSFVFAGSASPTGSVLQYFCSVSTPTIANLTVAGVSIKWYASSSGGSAFSSTNALVNGNHYYATQTVSGCESAIRLDVTVIINTPPTTTGVSICTGGVGSLTSSTACGSAFVNSGTTLSGVISASSLTANRINSMANSSSCGFSGNSRYYEAISFQVSTSGNYIFTMSSSFDAMGYLTSGAFVPGSCGSGTWIVGDDDSGGGLQPRLGPTNLIAGTTYVLFSTTYANGETGSFNWTITPPSGGEIMLNNPATIDWYTLASGGTKIGSGSPFNPVGVAGSGLSNTNTAGTTTYYAACSSNSGCRTATDFVINATSAPIVGVKTQPNCLTSTGSVALSGLPSTGTWTLTRSGTSSAITSGTGTSTTISGLAAGSYTYTVSIGGCTSVGTAIGNIVLNPVVTSTYNGSTWSSAPDLTMIGVINSNTPIASDVNLCNCTVNTGINAVVNPGITLKLQDKLTVNGTGTLTFENTSSLVQINNVLNTGNISYKRLTTTAVRKTDYTYWSTPVSPLKLAGVGGISYNPSSLAGSIFYSYLVSATSEDWTSESAASTMGIGKGYIIRGPESILSPFSLLEATFVGVPNNGNVSIAVGKSGASYLLGNPYPSAIDADSFLIANTTVLDGTLYFWTHNTQIGVGVSNPGTGVFAYSQDDYAAYNLTGGVGIVKGGVKADSDPNSPGVIPLGKIGAGQGFFATSQATGSIEFNNSMRVSGTSGNNAQFFKQSTVKGKATNGIEKNRIWLDLANEQGAFKQILVGYVTGATNDIDSAYDGETWDSHEFLDFYSVNQDKNLVIQGRSLPFDKDDEVPLGYRTTIDGDFSISIGQTDGLLTGQSVYIEDKLTNTITNLNNDIYTFNTSVGTFNDRFVLRYINKNLNIEDVDPKEYGIYVSNKNKEIKINSTTERINSVDIYDISGKLIFQKTKIDSNQLVISNLLSAHQVLLVSVSLLDGVVVTKKLIH